MSSTRLYTDWLETEWTKRLALSIGGSFYEYHNHEKDMGAVSIIWPPNIEEIQVKRMSGSDVWLQVDIVLKKQTDTEGKSTRRVKQEFDPECGFPTLGLLAKLILLGGA